MLRKLIEEKYKSTNHSRGTSQEIWTNPITPVIRRSKKKKVHGGKKFNSIPETTGLLQGPVSETQEWHITLLNDDTLYGITVDTLKNPSLELNGSAYFVSQFTGILQFGRDISSFSDDTPLTALLLSNISTDESNFVLNFNNILIQYSGVREDYQYAQIKVSPDGTIILLASFTDQLTYYNGTNFITLSDNFDGVAYPYILAKIQPVNNNATDNTWARTIWIKRISAMGLNNVQINMNNKFNSSQNVFTAIDTDIYVIGSFDGTLNFEPPGADTPITSNLSNDVFIARISTEGTIIWVKTSLKENINGNLTSTGFVRGQSVAVYRILDDPENNGNIVVMGTFDETLSFGNADGTSVQLINQTASSNTWIAKMDQSGKFIWMVSPIAGASEQSDEFFNGNQIIVGEQDGGLSSFYLTGSFMGNFILGVNDVNTGENPPRLFVAKLIDGLITPSWTWIRSIIITIPDSIYPSPHIAYLNGEIFINFYGLNLVIFTNEDDEDNKITFDATSGSLDNFFNMISTNGFWGNAPVFIAGTIENLSVNIAAGPSNDSNDPIYLIGTQTIGSALTSAYLRRY